MSDEPVPSDDYEKGYVAGSAAAWRAILREALRELGQNSPEWNDHRWRIERGETVAALRELCAEHGDNDWPDDAHLGDVLSKHLDFED